jgi:hypothetical protein
MRAVAMSQQEYFNSKSQLQQIRLQEKISLLRGKKIIGKNARLQQSRLQEDAQEQEDKVTSIASHLLFKFSSCTVLQTL